MHSATCFPSSVFLWILQAPSNAPNTLRGGSQCMLLIISSASSRHPARPRRPFTQPEWSSVGVIEYSASWDQSTAALYQLNPYGYMRIEHPQMWYHLALRLLTAFGQRLWERENAFAAFSAPKCCCCWEVTEDLRGIFGRLLCLINTRGLGAWYNQHLTTFLINYDQSTQDHSP